MDSPTYGPERRKPKRWAKRCEQNCVAVVTRMPLVLVYSLTTWAIWVEFGLSLHWTKTSSKGEIFSILSISLTTTGYIALFFGVVLYILLNWSYTTCAFTDPGSPLNTSPTHRHNYSHLPTQEPAADISSFTVKATGGARFCKKCQCKKPDRAHHCSSCKRCVLKMDHHCPWLASCVGLKNYKAFLLFLTYTTLFCWLCLGVSSSFVWTEIANEEMLRRGGLLGINMILLAVLSGIIGIVLTGFTGWHISLAIRNQTTIECLEKTRYSTPLKKTLQRVVAMPHGEDVGLMQRYGQQLAEIHANAIPGVTRTEEGEERTSPDPHQLEEQITAMEALRMNYNDMEREREIGRYETYLDEQNSEKLPNAFDLGWRRNLTALVGESRWLWFLPICNTIGDGWQWEASRKWTAAQSAIKQAREQQWQEQATHEEQAGWSSTQTNTKLSAPSSRGGRRSSSKADRVLGRTAGQYVDGAYDDRPSSEMSMQTFRKHSDDTSSLDGLYDNEDDYDISSDEAGTSLQHKNR